MSAITMENLGFVLRAGLAINRARALTEKGLFRKEEWTRADYLEALGDIGYLILESISGSKKLEARHLERTSSPKEERQNAESLSQIAGLLAGCSSFCGDFAAGRSFRQALLRSTLLGRSVVFIDRPLSFVTNSVPAVTRSSELVVKTTETVVYAHDMLVVMKQWQIFSNALYFSSRRNIMTHNETQTHKVPLTIPPLKGEYEVISDTHEENPVFSKYVCTINETLIRYPVAMQDGSTTNYYELRVLRKWIKEQGTNPCVPSEKIDLSNIHVDLVAQRAIEDEMRRLKIPLS